MTWKMNPRRKTPHKARNIKAENGKVKKNNPRKGTETIEVFCNYTTFSTFRLRKIIPVRGRKLSIKSAIYSLSVLRELRKIIPVRGRKL